MTACWGEPPFIHSRLRVQRSAISQSLQAILTSLCRYIALLGLPNWGTPSVGKNLIFGVVEDADSNFSASWVGNTSNLVDFVLCQWAFFV